MDNRLTIVHRLRSHAEEIHGLTDRLTVGQCKTSPAKGKWSVHELAMHLCEVQDVFVGRIARMLTEDKPKIVPYKPDGARENGFHLTEDFAKRLKESEAQRTTLASLLDTLTDEQWQFEGQHPQVKRYTIENAVEALVRHEEHHLYQIFNIVSGMERQP